MLSSVFSNKRLTAALKKKVPPPTLVRMHAIASYLSREPELRLLRGLVDPQKVAVDVGANRGVYAYVLSLLAQKVVAFEPIPTLCDALLASELSNVEVRQVALSSESGEATLHIPSIDGRELDTRASLNTPATEQRARTITVPTARLDAIDDLGDVGFVKIDVEGHEMEVLRGATGLLQSQRPNLVVEIEQRFLDVDVHGVFDWICAFGYRGAFWHRGRLHPLTDFNVDVHQHAHVDNLMSPDYVNNFLFKATDEVRS